MDKDYGDCLQSQFINVKDTAEFEEEELTAQIIPREQIKVQQTVEVIKKACLV